MTYSTCIARVFFNIRESRIRGVFRTLKCGEIERIDMIKKVGRDKKNFWCVFIHWKTLSEEVRSALDKNETVTIVYDDPWFWKMTKSRSSKPVRRAAPKMSIGDPIIVKHNGETWVDVGDAPMTPPSSPSAGAGTRSPPPAPQRLRRQRSESKGKESDSDGDNTAKQQLTYDKALQPDEEMRGASQA